MGQKHSCKISPQIDCFKDSSPVLKKHLRICPNFGKFSPMTHKSAFLLVLLSSSLALTACGGGMTREFDKNARYWQRIDTTDAIYQRAPKAQQMLFQDMAGCTAEINELQRLGAIRNSVPPSTWDSPNRDGALKIEHKDFTDFETCMTSKGWERVKYVDYETVNRSRSDYLDSIGYEKYRSSTNELQKRNSKLNN